MATEAIRELLERSGGRAGLRALLEDFYDRVFDDLMIGFFFREADKARLVEKELELALRLFGEDVAYTGEPLSEVHARHPILGGHFMRRLQILKGTMESHGLPAELQELWLRHAESLRGQVTADAGSDCRNSLMDPD